MKIIDPFTARRLARKSAARIARKQLLAEFAISNTKAASFPENPAYQERIRLSENEVKTLNDCLNEVLFPKRHVVIRREPLGPENKELANYMKMQIDASRISNAKAKKEKCE